jgi:hypothetical protein
LRIRPLLAILLISFSAQAADEINLFNGKDFSGWTFFLEEKEYNSHGKGQIADFASIKPGGVLELKPKLHGALMTDRDFLNYDLQVEYRWASPEPNDDSGIFLRIRPPFVWDMQHGEQARFYMVQIQPGNTGDLWVLGYSESMLKTQPERSFQPFGQLELAKGGHLRRHVKIRDAERPIGSWNTLDVSLQGKAINVQVNGIVVNEGTNLVDLPGRIGLESERGVVQFRNIRLRTRD